MTSRPTPSIESKTADLLAAGRVRVVSVSPEHTITEVRGDHGTWLVRFADGTWARGDLSVELVVR